MAKAEAVRAADHAAAPDNAADRDEADPVDVVLVALGAVDPEVVVPAALVVVDRAGVAAKAGPVVAADAAVVSAAGRADRRRRR